MAVLVTSWIAIGLAGCASPPEAKPVQSQPAEPRKDKGVRLSDEDIRSVLRSFVDRFALLVEAAADEIVAKANDRQIRRRAVLWKIRTIRPIRESLFETKAKLTAIHLWVFCAQMKRYFEEGDGQESFGPYQPIAIKAVGSIEADIVNLAKTTISDKLLHQIRQELDAWVQENPLRGPLASESGIPWTVDQEKAGMWRAWLKIPLSLTPLQQMDDTKTSIEAFTEETERIRYTATYLPQQIRWEIELLLYDLEDRQTVSSALSSFETLADSFDRLATEAKQLPTQLRKETALALDDLAVKSESLRSTITEIRGVTSESSQALEQAERVADAVQRAAASLTETGQAWEATAGAIGKLVPEDRGGAEGKSFDLNELNVTANSLTTTAIELRGLAADLQKLAGSGQLAAVLDTTTDQGRQLIDHLAWRLFQLIFASLVFAVIYRLLATRLVKGDKKEPG